MKLALVWVVVLLARPALADDPPTLDPDTEVARRRFDRGTQFYDEHKYVEAIAEFKAANEARPHPDLDYNIARCYDRLGDWSHALDYYRRYLGGGGKLGDTDEVRGRIAELEARTRPAPIAIAAPPPPRRLRVPAIVVGASAIVALAVGGGLYGWAAADFPSRKSYCAALPRECVPSEWADLAARANASYALFAVGGALAAADVALWIIDARRARATHARIDLRLAPGGATLVLGGAF